MKHLLKRNNKKISAYLCDKQIECPTSFNIIQQPRTMIQTKTLFVEMALGSSSF